MLYGSPVGLQASGIDAPDDQVWHQGLPAVADDAEVRDLFGWATAAGELYLYGSVLGLQASGELARDDRYWHQDIASVRDDRDCGGAARRCIIAEGRNLFGGSLAIGDLNGDEIGDLAVGVPRDRIGFRGPLSAGAVNVLYGWLFGLRRPGTARPTISSGTRTSRASRATPSLTTISAPRWQGRDDLRRPRRVFAVQG